MLLYLYKLTLDNGQESLAVGQVTHSDEREIAEILQSQAFEIPDASSIDDIIKLVKCCEAKGSEVSH